MRIGWIAPHLGCFGSIREIVELSNALVERGAEVTIHHPDGSPCAWLPCAAQIRPTSELPGAEYDLLLLVTEWLQDDYDNLLTANARIKGVVVMGFAPNDELAQMLTGWRVEEAGVPVLIDALHRPDIAVFSDGPWQLKWLEEHLEIETATWLGGVNIDMFYSDAEQREGIVIGASGDPRSRKGSDTVAAAFAIVQEAHPTLELETYWGKKLSQEELVRWYQRCTIFLDGHRRAGWCNPVFEAMACGAAVVCTDIPAVRPIAIHGETAMIVPVDDAQAMADATLRLLASAPRIQRIASAGAAKVRRYSYRRAASRLEMWLGRQLG